MHIIKINATDSTNSHLRKLSTAGHLDDYTIIQARHQLNGRGQMGAKWQSEKDKNLIVSVFKRFNTLFADQKFAVSMVVSIAVIKALKEMHIRNLKIKWPNDILADTLKIGGILIENIIKNNKIESSIIGIGINVNQTQFIDLPKATSILRVEGKRFEIDEIMHTIIKHMQFYFELLQEGRHDKITSLYHKHLFRSHKPSTFKDKKGFLFSGYIQGVTPEGTLQILLEDQITKSFDLKEVTLLY